MRKREIGRGERVLPGVWRLRLPLPWPGVPHCNAWALAAGDGIVLVDTGWHGPGSWGHLERALHQVHLRVDLVRRVVVTHAHIDHAGEAPAIRDAAGCEVWAHPRHEHLTSTLDDPEAALARRVEVARQSGVPLAPLQAYAEARRTQGSGVAGPFVVDRDLVPGVGIDTDLGRWEVVETPGHAPSHVCLFQRERRLLLSGDHLLGRVSLYYDYGWTDDPVGEFLGSLDRVEDLGARLCLPGHGRTFADVSGHIAANRALVAERIAKVLDVVTYDGPLTAFDAVPRVYEAPVTQMNAQWWLSETLCYLRRLEVEGRVVRQEGDPERWAAAPRLRPAAVA
jgi:glyoxylase-like metal-dependent hydrolase (beta-lactamase superfamily II)